MGIGDSRLEIGKDFARCLESLTILVAVLISNLQSRISNLLQERQVFIMSASVVIKILKTTWQKYGENNISRLGAALSYYTFASFFPLLLVLIALVGMIVNLGIGIAADTELYVTQVVAKELPAAGAVLEANIQQLKESSGTIGLIGLLTGLWAASNIFAQLQEAFDIIYGVDDLEQTWKDRLISRAQATLIVVLIALLMISSLALSTFLNTARSFVSSLPGGGYNLWLLNLGLSLGLMAGVFALLFKYIPNKLVTWKAAIIGGLFTSITWLIGRELLTWWLGRSAGPTAGTVVGSVLAFLALIYYAAQILMLGAQLTATYDEVVNPKLVNLPKEDDEPATTAKSAQVASLTPQADFGIYDESIFVDNLHADLLLLPPSNSGEFTNPSLANLDLDSLPKSGMGGIPLPSTASNTVTTKRSGFATFAAGYVAGLGALLLGLRLVLSKLFERR